MPIISADSIGAVLPLPYSSSHALSERGTPRAYFCSLLSACRPWHLLAGAEGGQCR
jgi:hypothetical protein